MSSGRGGKSLKMLRASSSETPHSTLGGRVHRPQHNTEVSRRPSRERRTVDAAASAPGLEVVEPEVWPFRDFPIVREWR